MSDDNTPESNFDVGFFCFTCDTQHGELPTVVFGDYKRYEHGPTLIDKRGQKRLEGWVCPVCGDANVTSDY